MILYKEPENISLAMRSTTNDVAIDNISKWRHIGRDRGGALQTAHENDCPLAFSLLFYILNQQMSTRDDAETKKWNMMKQTVTTYELWFNHVPMSSCKKVE